MIAALRAGARERLEGMAPLPLVLLTLLYFFDEFDTAAFGTLAPDIQRAFGLSDERFGTLLVANSALLLLLAVPIGFLADRIPRVPLAVASGILAGAFSLMTGFAGSLTVLVIARFGNGLGLVANGGVHNSLLADYYAPRSRPTVYGVHSGALQLGAIAGPVFAGVLGSAFGWRAPFFVLFIPIIGVSVLTFLRLREPARGGTDDPEAAAEAAAASEKVGVKEGFRTLWAVKTLKRQFISALFLGAAILPLAAYLPLYFHRVFHLGPFARGLVGAGNATATLAGTVWSARRTTVWAARSAGEPLRRAGAAVACVGLTIALVAIAPVLPLALVFGFAGYAAIGVYFPPTTAVQADVSPARVRTLSFSIAALFLVGGAVALFYAPGLGAVSDDHGIRWGLGITVPYWLVGGFLLATAGRFVADDTAKARRSLQAAASLREQRLAAKEQSLLVCSGVEVAYGSVQVLFGVDLDIHEGEIVALLGTNGAGKSTILKAVSGLVDPIGGSIIFDGVDVTHADPRRAVERGIIQMPGGRSVFPTLTIKESLRLAGSLYKKQDPEHVRQATETVLDYFPILRERSDQLAGNLSGGEQQMLGLAMAFIAKPRLLMIDELSLGLAPVIVGQLVDIVRRIHAAGTTVVIVEQSVNVALTLAERAIFMEKGEVRFSGATAELLERNDLLRSVFLEGTARPATTAPTARRELAPDAERDVVLGAEGVSVRFGGINAVSDVTFELRRGDILGVIGPNGAGKTTLFDALSGFAPVATGRVSFLGQDVTPLSPDKRALAGLGRSFQDARLFSSMTVVENLALAFERFLPVRDTLAAALGLPATAEQEHRVALSVDDLVELLNLQAFRNKFISELSTGSRRIVDIGMALAHRPEVLILDEPSSGIAQRETEALGPLLQRIHADLGCSLLVIEHDMPLILGISNRLLALETGRVIAYGEPDDVIADPAVIRSYLDTDDAVINRSGTGPGEPPRPPRRQPRKVARIGSGAR